MEKYRFNQTGLPNFLVICHLYDVIFDNKKFNKEEFLCGFFKFYLASFPLCGAPHCDELIAVICGWKPETPLVIG